MEELHATPQISLSVYYLHVVVPSPVLLVQLPLMTVSFENYWVTLPCGHLASLFNA